MEIRNENGTLKTCDQLYDDAIEELVDVLECLDDSDALMIGNEYRDDNRYSTLYYLDECTVNDVLSGENPWDIINLDIDTRCDYFTYDGYDFNCTNDVWEDIDLEDLARAILSEDVSRSALPSDVEDVLDDYNERLEELESISQVQRDVINLVARFKNCEADQYDLIAMLDKLARSKYTFEED